DGEVRDTTGGYRKSVVGLNTEAKLTPAEAIEIARKDFQAEPSDQYSAQLIIYPGDGDKNSLAYLVTMPLWRDNVPLRLRYFIDANSGEILHKFNDQSVTGEATSTRGIANRLSSNQ